MVDSEDVEKKPDEYFTSFNVICASCASTNTMVSFVLEEVRLGFHIIKLQIQAGFFICGINFVAFKHQGFCFVL